jgi:hypothetical protein
MAPLIFYTIEKKLFKEITRLYAIYTIPWKQPNECWICELPFWIKLCRKSIWH